MKLSSRSEMSIALSTSESNPDGLTTCGPTLHISAWSRVYGLHGCQDLVCESPLLGQGQELSSIACMLVATSTRSQGAGVRCRPRCLLPSVQLHAVLDITIIIDRGIMRGRVCRIWRAPPEGVHVVLNRPTGGLSPLMPQASDAAQAAPIHPRRSHRGLAAGTAPLLSQVAKCPE